MGFPAVWKARGFSPEGVTVGHRAQFLCVREGSTGRLCHLLGLGCCAACYQLLHPCVKSLPVSKERSSHVCKDLILTSKHMVSIAAFCCGQNTGFLGVNLLQGIALRLDEVAKDRAS